MLQYLELVLTGAPASNPSKRSNLLTNFAVSTGSTQSSLRVWSSNVTLLKSVHGLKVWPDFCLRKKNLWQIGAASPTSILCSIRWVLEGMFENKDGNDKIRLVNSFSFHPANNNLSKLTKDSVFELGLHNIVIWVIYQLFTTGKPLPAQKPPEPLTFSPHRFWPTWTRKIRF